MARVLWAIVLTTVFGSTTFSQPPAPVPAASLAVKVDQLFAQWDKPDTPGCALAVISDGQIIYKRGYGMANLELAVPITTTSVFNVGSMAKQFTAMAVLMLAQQGKLSLDDKIQKYVPSVPDFGTPLTLRHLLHHTSGLRDQFEMLQMAGWRDDVETEQDILEMVARQRTLNFKPGDEYSYSNTGYVLLGLVARRVAGQALPEFVEANIFKPLGMTHTHLYDDHRAIIKGLVAGYLPTEGGGFQSGMPADDFVGAGNLFTTVEDLARWDQNFYDKSVGGAAVIEQMLVPGVLNNGEKLEYAAGLYINQYKGLRLIQHNGSRVGYRAQLLRFPDQRFSVACLCNVRNSPDELARGVADIYLADKLKRAVGSQGSLTVTPTDAVKLTEKELTDVAGLYFNPAADTVRRVYVKEGKLMYARAPGNESELAPLGGNRFLMLGVQNRVEINFKSPRPGAPFQLLFAEAGRKPSVQELVKPATYMPQQLTEFAGAYYCPELDATYDIMPQEGKLLLRAKRWGEFLLSPRFADSFANPQQIGSLLFTRARKNRVSGFVIRSGKVKNLRFDKIK